MHRFRVLLFIGAFLCNPILAEDEPECASSVARITKNYPTANFDTCEVLDENSFVLSIVPEDEPINPSPWYGFAVERLSDVNSNVKVSLRYRNTTHRYSPKFSSNKRDWVRLDRQLVESADGSSVAFEIPKGNRRVYVSAQPIIDEAMYETWVSTLLDIYPFLTRETLGHSVAKRPIESFALNTEALRVIVLLGRQHPPEVSGSMAFMAFAEKLLELYVDAHEDQNVRVVEFFRQHMIVFVPLLNPDGVQEGYWRHNLRGTDLNRDWFEQAQPETQSVIRYLANLKNQGKEVVLHIDFHSTRRDVLYTQMPNDKTTPAKFASDWLAFVQNRGRAQIPEHAPRPLTDQGTAKGYFFKTYAVPSITYEVGDESKPNDVRLTAAEFALGMASIYGELVLDPAQVDSETCDTLFCLMVNANGASLLVLEAQGLINSDLAAKLARAQIAYKRAAEQQGWPSGQNYLIFEEAMIEKLGPEGSNVHIGRSRQDLHGIARRMLVRLKTLEYYESLLEARTALLEAASRHSDVVIPAYTHGVPSQPTTYAHLLLAFDAAFSRDIKRLQNAIERLNLSQLGVAAGSGSSFNLDRERLGSWLGFKGIVANTYDANFLSTADYKLEISAVMSQSIATISKFLANVHAQQRNPRPWIYLSDDLVSGSSIMPQKRNPRELDRIRTLVAQVIGGTNALQMMNHNVDTGMHDYRTVAPLIETMDLAESVNLRFALLLDGIHVDDEVAMTELLDGFSTSTEIAETLYREARVPFRTAHEYAKKVVEYARDTEQLLTNVASNELERIYQDVVGEDLPVPVEAIENAIDPRLFIEMRDISGGPSEKAISAAIGEQRRSLAIDEQWLRVRRAHLRYVEDRLNSQLRNLSAR
ncbi:MAG: lyase family protein [Gammaproteobacteria bacterium]|nr:lyase family protein [Gammaproteobacteria bacterium]